MVWIIVILLAFILIALLGKGSWISSIFGIFFLFMLFALAVIGFSQIFTPGEAVFVSVLLVGALLGIAIRSGFKAAKEENRKINPAYLSWKANKISWPGDEPAAIEGNKTCPFCAEEIKDAAVICKHCGKEQPK